MVSFYSSETMLANPVIEAQNEAQKEASAAAAFRMPFKICCVMDPGDEENHPVLKKVRDFCTETQIPFYSRSYNPTKFDEDCHFISYLPAFHVYDKRGYKDTFFPKDRPIQIIQSLILEWKEEERKKAEKAAARRQKVARLIAFFENLTIRKKPALQTPLKPKKVVKAAAVPVAYGDSLPSQPKP